MNRHRHGFSLIELLVVILIVVVLAGMLMPAMRTVREAALGTRCASNLRQMAIAADTYSSEWHGMIVPGYTGPYGWHFWYDLMAPYTDEQNIISIPSRGRILRGCPKWQTGTYYNALPVGAWQWQQYSGYCETQFLLPQWQITAGGVAPYPFGCTWYDQTWWGTTLDNQLARVTRRSDRPYLFDASHASVDVVGWWPQADCKANLQRHTGKANVLYFDGHVDRNTWSDVANGQGLLR